ncbi:phage virion morphogenesis protein [Kosakonia pseudosacchari]|uniref:phage virion morphogenesis protein n=1 Tax=Kosakonia pseudosacchari TaxID=1646340 RepID=UPI00187F6531|nr:phage virion morphogenesis protein [Kosakonia pseudosacchari]QOV63489.1 phage virion morphogenesis protein [Kosakonia pseudosacchari]
MNEFKPFDDKLAGLLAAMSPAGRRRLTVDIAKKLRQRQQQRIKSQKAPDGTPYAPRKSQPLRAKQGRIKREMFAKLRTNRYMKASGNDSAAVVEFTGKVQRIARVHQFGLKEKPGRNAREVHYEKRVLLGSNNHDEKDIEDIIIDMFRGFE